MAFDDPYDPNSQDTETETPTLEATMAQVVDAALIDLHTHLPAKITAVKGNQKVSVQILIKTKLRSGQVIDRPVIQDVPVWMPGGQNYWVKLPIAVGDVGELHFAERSLDKYKIKGGATDPGDPRKFDLSDAVFYPGGRAFNDQLPGAAGDLIIHRDTDEIGLKPDGSVTIKSDKINLGDYTLSKHVAIAEAVVARLEALENGLTQLRSDLVATNAALDAHGHATNTPPVAPGTSAPPTTPPAAFTPDTSTVPSATAKVKE